MYVYCMYVVNKNAKEARVPQQATTYAREFVFNEEQFFRIPENSYFFN